LRDKESRKTLMDRDMKYLHRAIQLAREAQQAGNLPVGAVVSLDGKVVAEGKNSIWIPKLSPSRHAEIEALEAVPSELWARAQEMTLYTTLEPCLMCISAILIHRIGRVVFGSRDDRGGASCVFGHMPPALEEKLQVLKWIGPVLPTECDDLCETVLTMVAQYNKRI
jgi:tRNA(adenine34) deaminase